MTDSAVPANDQDAERILLATMAGDPACIPEMAALVSPEDFYRPEHREIVAACYALEVGGNYVEPASVLAWLVDAGRLQHAGGRESVVHLLESEQTSQSPDQYARRIALLAAVRAVDSRCGRLVYEARSGMDDPRSWLSEAPEIIRAAAASGLRSSNDSLRGIRDVASSILAGLSSCSETTSTEDRIGTGLDALDAKIGKLARKGVHVIAARPGVGKTALAHQMVIRAARRGVRCLYCSLEMPAEDLLSRSVAQIAGVDHRLIELRGIDYQHSYWEHITRAINEVSALPICYEDSPVQSVAGIRGSVRRASKDLGGDVDLLVIDYVQLLKTAQRRGASRTELIGENSHAIMAMAKDLGCAVVEVSQLNRPPKNAKIGPPKLEDLRECGDLEQDARVVIGVYREDMKQAYSTAELHVLKCRQGGRVGVVNVAWSGPTMSFADIPGWQEDDERESDQSPVGRGGHWTPPGRRDPPPRPWNETADRDEGYGIPDGFGGL